MKHSLATLSLLLTALISNAQFEGPKEADKLKLVKIAFEAADNFQLKCIPENTDWEAAQSLSSYSEAFGATGKKTIYFVPQKEQLYTFILATVEDGKPKLYLHEVKVGQAPPAPTPDSIEDEIRAAYLTSPNAEDAKKLHKALSAWANKIDNGDYTIESNQAKADLKKLTKDTDIADTSLRPFRDKVAELLTKATNKRDVLGKAIKVLAIQANITAEQSSIEIKSEKVKPEPKYTYYPPSTVHYR